MSDIDKKKDEEKKLEKRKRQYSKPKQEKQLVINTEFGLRALDDYVKRTLSALYALDVILFFIGSEDMAHAANDKISKKILSYINTFDKYMNKLEALSDECDIKSIAYTQSRPVDFVIYSPLAHQYLKMFKKMELCINLSDALWFSGDLGSKERVDMIKKLSRMMSNISGEIRNVAKQAEIVAKSQGKGDEIKEGMEQNDIVTNESGEFNAPIVVSEVDSE